MKLIMMWLWTTTWYYKKHHETTCKSMRHFLPTTQPSVSYFKWLWWICSNDASNAGVDAVGKPSRRVAPIASSPGKVITAPGVTPVMRKGEIWLPLRGIHQTGFCQGSINMASCTCEGRVHHLIIKIHIQIKQEYDHDARFHRHSVEVATGKRNQYENRLNKRFCDSQRLLSFEHAEICQYSSYTHFFRCDL